MRIAFIGNGAIRRLACDVLGDLDPSCETVAVLVRPGQAENDPIATASLEELIARRPDLVVECASHAAVEAYGERILAAGISLLLVSIGALSDDALHERLHRAAHAGHSRLLLASGAVGGLDALRAARLGGLDEVVYKARKPAASWAGNPCCADIDLDRLEQPRVIYSGSAREAARAFPKNSNVAAAVALAGIGLDATRVELIADPGAVNNHHHISFSGRDGRFSFELCGNPAPDNPRTSMLTAHSVAQSIVEFGRLQ